jgi:folylpolyglutamate synthase/dihydrofolate synthase
VEVAVVEVGLGGITDATNVIDGQVAVITPISLDHTDLLGDSVEDIAYEKSGIIKPGGFLISAAQPVEAAQVLLEKAREVHVPFRFEGVEFHAESRLLAVGGQQVTVSGLAGRYEDLLLPLYGAHQAQNAAVAVAALEAFLGGGEKPLDVEVLREAFRSVTSPGRIEVVRTAPTIIVDAAHNPDGMRVTAEAISEAFNFTKLVPVVGVLQEKDAVGVLEALRTQFATMLATKTYVTGGLGARWDWEAFGDPYELPARSASPPPTPRAPSIPSSWPRTRWPPASPPTPCTSNRSSTTRWSGRWSRPKPTTIWPAVSWSPGPSPWWPTHGSCSASRKRRGSRPWHD